MQPARSTLLALALQPAGGRGVLGNSQAQGWFLPVAPYAKRGMFSHNQRSARAKILPRSVQREMPVRVETAIREKQTLAREQNTRTMNCYIPPIRCQRQEQSDAPRTQRCWFVSLAAFGCGEVASSTAHNPPRTHRPTSTFDTRRHPAFEMYMQAPSPSPSGGGVLTDIRPKCEREGAHAFAGDEPSRTPHTHTHHTVRTPPNRSSSRARLQISHSRTTAVQEFPSRARSRPRRHTL